MKRSPMKRSTKPLRRTRMNAVGKVGKKWQIDREVCRAEWLNVLGELRCVLQYEGCWRRYEGFAHSAKRPNRTRPEHDVETAPGCNFCHEKLERMGIEGMAAEVRRIRVEYGLPIWE